MNTKLSFVLAPSLLFACSYLQAEDFQLDAGILLDEASFERDAIESDSSGLILGGSFYLQPVDDSKGPLSEAAFIQHASDITLVYSTRDFDDSDLEVSSTSVSTRIVLDNNFFFTASFENTETEDGFSSEDTDEFSIGGGLYVDELTTGSFTYISEEIDSTDDQEIFLFEARSLLMNQTNTSFVLEGSIGFVESDSSDGDGKIFYLGAIAYPSSVFGIGASYGLSSFETTDSDIFTLTAEYFASPEISFQFFYSLYTDEADGLADGELDILGFGASLRV